MSDRDTSISMWAEYYRSLREGGGGSSGTPPTTPPSERIRVVGSGPGTSTPPREERVDPLAETVDLIRRRFEEIEAPVKLRWEAAGDARHAAAVLGRLQEIGVPFRAQIHHFEEVDHPNVEKAGEHLAPIFERLEETGSKIVARTGVDVTRKGSGSRSRDFIFIRNLVGTDDETKRSSITDLGVVRDLHRDAMRQRRNSLRLGGEMLVGGSGYPFVSHRDGDTDYMRLKAFAPVVKMKSKGSLTDTVGVMQDSGKTLKGLGGGAKTTHIHRFAPLPPPKRGTGGGRSKKRR